MVLRWPDARFCWFAGGVGRICGWGADSTGVPHMLKKREPDGNSLWQLEQAKTTALPHSRQKLESAGFSRPQEEQRIGCHPNLACHT